MTSTLFVGTGINRKTGKPVTFQVKRKLSVRGNVLLMENIRISQLSEPNGKKVVHSSDEALLAIRDSVIVRDSETRNLLKAEAEKTGHDYRELDASTRQIFLARAILERNGPCVNDQMALKGDLIEKVIKYPPFEWTVSRTNHWVRPSQFDMQISEKDLERILTDGLTYDQEIDTVSKVRRHQLAKISLTGGTTAKSLLEYLNNLRMYSDSLPAFQLAEQKGLVTIDYVGEQQEPMTALEVEVHSARP